MLRKEFASEANGDGERLAARIMTQFLLRYCAGLANLAGGDLLKGVILAAIMDANVGHLISCEPGNREFGGLNAVVPDHQRRPISISAISRIVGVPYETTRRHVGKMIEEGICARTDKGVFVREAWVREQLDVTSALYTSLRLMLFTLHQTGFDLSAMARTPLAPRELKRLEL